jgi:hypothetical protein
VVAIGIVGSVMGIRIATEKSSKAATERFMELQKKKRKRYTHKSIIVYIIIT